MKRLGTKIISILFMLAFSTASFGAISSKEYVDKIADAAAAKFEKVSNRVTSVSAASTDDQYPTARAVYSHVGNTSNPHAVTKAQVGLSNVKDVDQTNASNLTSGTVSYGRLPVGTSANTVTAGDDVRMWAIPTSQKSGTPPVGWTWFWIEP